MKLNRILLLIGSSILLAYCSSKKSASSTPAASTSSAPTETQLANAQKKYTSATMDDLKEGMNIYQGPCTGCHGMKKIETRSEEQWTKIIASMAPKAKLTPEQTNKLTWYVQSYRETNAAK